MKFKLPSFFERKSSVSEAQINSVGNQSFTLDNQEAYAKEGYGQNSTVFRCIDYIAKNAASIVPLVKVNGERVEGHALELLLKQPNIDEGGIEFRTAAFSWALLIGTSFTEKLKSGSNNIELWNWQPYNMSIKTSSINPRLPSAVCFNENSKGSKKWDVNPITGETDMLVWRSFNPSPDQPFWGQSPLQAGAAPVDTLNAANKWRYNTILNDCRPSAILSTEQDVTEPQRQALQKDLNKRSGPSQNGKTMITGGGFSYQQIGMNMKDSDWLQGTKLNKQEICEVFGVPTQLLGIEGSNTYANYSEARMAFYLDTVMPLTDLYFSELNRWLAPEFGENVEICYDKESIEALKPMFVEDTRMKMESGVMTVNEKRELIGLEPSKSAEADEIFMDSNKIPLDFDSSMDEPEVDIDE